MWSGNGSICPFPEAECGKCFRFTITTNGVLLDDETIEYINREMDNCVLSLDGRREVNDRFRVSPNGKGSYDVIVPKFKSWWQDAAIKILSARHVHT